jgi:hypothetical protein
MKLSNNLVKNLFLGMEARRAQLNVDPVKFTLLMRLWIAQDGDPQARITLRRLETEYFTQGTLNFQLKKLAALGLITLRQEARSPRGGMPALIATLRPEVWKMFQSPEGEKKEVTA